MGKTILVCQNADCMARGSGAILQALREKLAAADGVEVKEYMCFGACQAGPNIVVHPDKVWYAGVSAQDVNEIAGHARGGPVVERLTGGVDESLKTLIYQLLDAGLY